MLEHTVLELRGTLLNSDTGLALNGQYVELHITDSQETVYVPVIFMFNGISSMLESIHIRISNMCDWDTSQYLMREEQLRKFFYHKSAFSFTDLTYPMEPAMSPEPDQTLKLACEKGALNPEAWLSVADSWNTKENIKKRWMDIFDSTAWVIFAPVPHDLFCMNSRRIIMGLNMDVEFRMSDNKAFYFTVNSELNRTLGAHTFESQILDDGFKLWFCCLKTTQSVQYTSNVSVDAKKLMVELETAGTKNFLYGKKVDCSQYVNH